LTTIGADLTIVSTPAPTLSLPSLQLVGGTVSVDYGGHSALLLPSLTDVSGWFRLDDNSGLLTVETPMLEAAAFISISQSSSLSLVSFPTLTSCPYVHLEENDSLAVIDLPLLTSTDLLLWSNDALETVDGFPSLSVLGELQMSTNSSLTDVTGLHDVTAIVGDLTVADNPSLPTSAAEALRDAIGIENIGGTITISGNGPG
jgi:hypothetical protein